MGEVIEVVAVEAKGYREICENHVDGQNWELAGGSIGKGSICNAGDLGSILGCKDPLEKGKATRPSILA